MKLNHADNWVGDTQGGFVPGWKERIILGKLPEWTRSRGNMQLNNVKKMNRYLQFQSARIEESFRKGEHEQGIRIWMKLLQESWAYQLVLFHRSNPSWYWKLDQQEARNQLAEASNALRKWNVEIMIRRFYIRKKNGKLRPIGAPNLKSKMVGKAFADMMLWCGGSDIPYQHGFTPGKGIHTAVYDIITLFEKGATNIFEFDLKGWFNHVRPIWVKETLSKYSKTLSILFGHLIYKTHIKFTKLEQEAELEKIGETNGKAMIARNGMTQGMPYSPVAANIALSGVNYTPKGLVMYADDGVCLSEEKIVPDWLSNIQIVGARLAMEKSGWVTGPFQFLGVTLDLNGKSITYQGVTTRWKNWEEEKSRIEGWLKGVTNRYTRKTPSGWHWDIKKDAYITGLSNQLSLGLRLRVWIGSLWSASTTKGYRYFLNGGLQDVLSSSSRCMELIAKDRGMMYRAKIRKYELSGKSYSLSIDRKDYTEVIPYAYHPNGHPNVIGGRLLVSVRSRPVK